MADEEEIEVVTPPEDDVLPHGLPVGAGPGPAPGPFGGTEPFIFWWD